MSATAQDQKDLNSPERDLALNDTRGFLRNDSYSRPYSSDEVQRFCDYVKRNPIVKDLNNNHKVPEQKIRVARDLYLHTNDENQKKKILDLMMGMFTDIQVARDTLGVDPMSRTESWLYVDPETLTNDPSEFENLKEEMIGDQQRLNEGTSRMNKLSKKISNLESIHAYLHQAITIHLKIPLPEISLKLERSPAEKARTKDLLEKQAAASGRKKPEPETSVNEGK